MPYYRVRLDVGTGFSRGYYRKHMSGDDKEHAIAKVRAMANREGLAFWGVEECLECDDEGEPL